MNKISSCKLLAAALLLFLTIAPATATGGEYLAIAYHNVVPGTALGDDTFAITVASFIEQMEYLKSHGYTPVSLDDIMADRARRRLLPERAVLLTFDDGLASFYRYVFPILKLYDYPAVLAVVTSWADSGQPVSNSLSKDKKNLMQVMSWEQIAEVSNSNLVEIASHSHDLHKGVVYNPQGNEFAAGNSFIYDPETGSYETDEQFGQRIRDDLQVSMDKIAQYTGKQPRIIVWPYGQFNKIAQEMASDIGMKINFSVEDGINNSSADIVNRGIIMGRPLIGDFVTALRRNFIPEDPVRAVQVDLDSIYDDDSKVVEENLGRLLERLVTIGANMVFLQAFADPDGDGNASELYFPNSVLPVRSNLFNRVAHQITTRTKVEAVYAWMPLMAFDLPDKDETAALLVKKEGGEVENSGYARLSLFSADAREKILSIYEDLARYNNIAGLLFQDDAYLTDFEDFHPDAKKAYRKRFGRQLSMKTLTNSPELMQEWTEFKTASIIDFTDKVALRVKKYRPTILVARNIYASILTEPYSEEWFAQNYGLFLERYDKVVVMAYPYMEGARHPLNWLAGLVDSVSGYKGWSEKTIFKLQARDWGTEKWVPAEELNRQMVQLVNKRARNIAYYPDSMHENRPRAEKIKEQFSLKTSPFFK